MAGMPRKPRRLPPGGTFHVYNRGACRQEVFVTTEDRLFFLDALARVAKDLGWRVLAICLMGNHYHLIVETPKDNLVKGMHLLKTRVTIRFNRVHGTTGHVYERRFNSVPVETQEYFEFLLGYVALNPVRAGLCERPDGWTWSSYGRVVRGEQSIVDVGRLFERLGRDGGDPLVAYRRAIELVAGSRRSP